MGIRGWCRASAWVLVVPGVAALALACGDPLPGAPSSRLIPSEAGAGAGGLLFDPQAPAFAVEPVSRVMLRLDQPFRDARVMLLRGAVTSAQLRDLARPVLTEVLAERAVAAAVWVSQDRALISLSPYAALEAGALYTVGVSSPAQAWPFTVSLAATRRTLARMWPPAAVARGRCAVWCGNDALALWSEQTSTFAPAEVVGTFRVGTGAGVSVPTCVAWHAVEQGSRASSGLDELPALAPPLLELDSGETVALQPAALLTDLVGGGASDAPPRSCIEEEIPLAGGCADVQDDRVVIRAPPIAVLWTIAGGGSPSVHRTSPGERFQIRPLPADGHLSITTLDAQGQSTTSELAVVAGAARSHVVINEVMANPRAAEPAQEWVELYNDGIASVTLAGYTLEDAQGAAVLPPVELAAGAYALIVSRAYSPNPELDAAPLPGTPLVSIDALALSNEGERLTLRDPGGRVVSVFLAVKTKNGVAIVRRAPDAEEGDPDAFTPSTAPGGSTPGAPD